MIITDCFHVVYTRRNVVGSFGLIDFWNGSSEVKGWAPLVYNVYEICLLVGNWFKFYYVVSRFLPLLTYLLWFFPPFYSVELQKAALSILD